MNAKTVFSLFFISHLLCSLLWASPPKTLVSFPFDAWYSIYQNQKKIGYFFSRYEWADKSQKQIRYSSTLIRIMNGKFFEEQLQETATAEMKPLSLKYRKVGDQVEDFTNIEISGATATIENKASMGNNKKTIAFPEDSIFGSFVNFLFLSMKATMKPGEDYAKKVLDEGDFTVKECRLRLKGPSTYTLSCLDQVGEYVINNTGMVTYQSAGNKELEVKKTSMAAAMKGFPKPGERKP